MGEAGMAFLLSQLVYFAPVLVVYLVALVLALVFLRRARGAAILTALGAIVLAVSGVGVAVAQASLFEAQVAGDLAQADFARQMRTLGIAGTCLHAVGLGLWVAAVFVGRPARGRAEGDREPN
jgi:hypothetical protein